MHRRRVTRTQAAAKRLLIATMTAVILTSAIVVATWDPTEALCAVYTPDDPEWYLFACWRFPPRGSLLG